MARNDKFDLLRAAYSVAWDTRTHGGDKSFDILSSELRKRGLGDTFVSDGPGRDMMVRIWERGVPPAKLKSALLLEVSRVGFQAARAIGGAYWSIARLFAGTKWERVDMSHLDMPTGHKKLSEDRKAFDLVLRHFHKPVYEIELEVTLNDQAGILNERYQLPSPNRREAFELPAWLRLADQSPDAAVMVGPHIVGLTELPGEAWEDLVVESANDIYADGRLFLPFAGDESASIQCVVPKRVN